MQFTVNELGRDVTVIEVDGKLNMASAPRLREIAAEAINSGRYFLSVDLSGVDFIDSSGLGALVGALKAAREAGGDLRISSPAEQVRLILELTNMTRMLPAYEDATTAFSER